MKSIRKKELGLSLSTVTKKVELIRSKSRLKKRKSDGRYS